MQLLIAAAGAGLTQCRNLLAGREDLFKISNSRLPCTQGVDLSASTLTLDQFARIDGGACSEAVDQHELHDTPDTLDALDQQDTRVGHGMRVGFCDAEGQGDRDVTYDARLICPLLLASKAVLFNWKARYCRVSK